MMTRLKDEMSLTEMIKLGTVLVTVTIVVMVLRSDNALQNQILDRLEVGQSDLVTRVTDIETAEREYKAYQRGLEAGRAEAPDG